MVMGCFRPLSLHRRVKTLLLRLRGLTRKNPSPWKKTTKNKSRLLSSSFDLLPSSFSTMEVSTQFEQVFKVFDANGDGKISASELTEVLLCLGYEKSTAADEARAMMTEMDSNGDGFIDLHEFMVAMNPVNGNSLNGNGDDYDHLMDAFMIFDADKNGLISDGELRRVLLSLGCTNCSLSECKRMIKGVDRDGDGFVDFEEFRSMMRTRK